MAAACSGTPKAGAGFESEDGGTPPPGQGYDSGGPSNGTDTGTTGMFTPGSDSGVTGSSDADLQGDGPIDTTPPCDMGLAVDDANAASFAKALGICTTVSGAGYGLVSATYSNAYGSTTAPHAGQWGLLPGFGSVIIPREGSSIGVLSSGYARQYDDAQGTLLNTMNDPFYNVGADSDFVNSSPDGPLDGMNYPTGTAPPGFPQAAQGCQQDNLVNDMIDVKLVLKAPPNATGFQFDFDFYSSEWPNFVCSNYNDAFVAYVTSNETTGNVSFDSNKDPIAVNAAFFDRCTSGAPLGCGNSQGMGAPTEPVSTCGGGTSELSGTGFGDMATTICGTSQDVSATLGGATGWLTTSAPIKGGEQFTIDFMIWDAGDGLLDSSVLLDHFVWIGGTTTTTPVTTRPPQ
jgi:hypothetical protein